MSNETDFGKQRLRLLEVDQAFCTRTYGTSPCTAALGVTGPHKCHNTEITCQDLPNYVAGVQILRFVRPQMDTMQYGNVIPAIASIEVTPASVNLAAMNRNESALGAREVLDVTLYDFPHDDHLVDKYRLERTTLGFNPLIDNGTAQAGAATTLTLRAGASGTDDFYNGRLLRLTGGTGAGQERIITDYVGSTKVATVDTWDVTPNGTTTYEVRTIFDPSPAYDPHEQGTFWGKLLARNPFYESFNVRLLDGFIGDALGSMTVRHYALTRIDGPSKGRVRLTAKDLFSKVESRKAVAPKLSTGELNANITNVATSATLKPSGIGNAEYPASGWVTIGSESMAFTRSGDVLTLTRAQLGTVAAAHDADDLVQIALSYDTELGHDIVYDLLLNYTELLSAQLPKTDWDAAMDGITELYSTVVTKPTPVLELVGELCEQVGFTLCPNMSTDEVDLVPLRAAAPTTTIDDATGIVKNSFSRQLKDDKRVSQVWVFYGQISRVEDIDDEKNYRSRLRVIDLEREASYGGPVIKKIYSRWISQFGRTLALKTGNRIIEIFRDTPLECNFKLHSSRLGDVSLAKFATLRTADIQDVLGAVLPTNLAVTEIEHDEDVLLLKAEQVVITPEDAEAERVIFIDSDVKNINLRAVHDSIYSAPEGTETVRFVIAAGVFVGSTSVSVPSIDTGDWPPGVALFLDANLGGSRVQGKGGRGGQGGNHPGGSSPTNGQPGENGGDAIKATYPITIDNLNGEIWAGGAGGGGGGAADNDPGNPGNARAVGGGGGGAAGSDPGDGGAHGTGAVNTSGHTNGSAGTTEAGGSPGTGGDGPTTDFANGGGGAGGGPGLDGTAGQLYTGPSAQDKSNPGAGGTKGRYIVGNSFVTWVNNGDRRGSVA